MRQYEFGIILRVDIPENDASALLDTIRGWIEANQGTITAADHWGRRRLAYPIEKQRDGYYVFYKATLQPESVYEVERNLRLSENVLRFIVVKEGE